MFQGIRLNNKRDKSKIKNNQLFYQIKCLPHSKNIIKKDILLNRENIFTYNTCVKGIISKI